MKCEECDRECDMVEPTIEAPERRFRCPECETIYFAIDLFTEEDLRLN